jgi:hypothetical protein
MPAQAERPGGRDLKRRAVHLHRPPLILAALQ